MFQAEGDFQVQITDVQFATAKFANGPYDFDIAMTVQAEQGQVDVFRMEMSQRMGRGNFAGQSQAQITMDRLRKLGFQGDDLSQLKQQLIGKTTVAHVESNTGNDGKTYYNIKWLGTNNSIQEIGDYVQRFQQLMGGGQSNGFSGQAQAFGGTPNQGQHAPQQHQFQGQPQFQGNPGQPQPQQNPFQ
jgi:hypothetical protein